MAGYVEDLAEMERTLGHSWQANNTLHTCMYINPIRMWEIVGLEGGGEPVSY